ncbi:hypothetical protein JG687_00017936 [Phytophthora cactorum]|uniref:Uncharacterized protein n=1 Tax=Phytophthora cactorum TaxID=29920 RepID=A0A8T1TP31_9STRA|nr:hypothetical protein JG687_00017936 [Phytophthora cactorum]
MAAVNFAHKSIRNARLPEFEFIPQGYKRINSHVDRKQPVTTTMLCEMHRMLQQRRTGIEDEEIDLL